MRIVIARGRSQTRLYVLQVLYLSYRTKIIIVSRGCAMEILRLKIGGGVNRVVVGFSYLATL